MNDVPSTEIFYSPVLPLLFVFPLSDSILCIHIHDKDIVSYDLSTRLLYHDCGTSHILAFLRLCQ